MQAVAACAGYHIVYPQVDDDSTDGQLQGREGMRPRLDFQLKSTGQPVIRNSDLHFSLPIKNYNDLRTETIVPRILIIVLLPQNDTEWLGQTEEQLVMRKCAYWQSLSHEPDVENTATITVKVPRAQVFSVEQVRELMTQIALGGSA